MAHDGGGRKRAFPYESAVADFTLKRATGVEGGVHPGQEPSQPRIFEQPSLYDNYGDRRRHEGTDFSTWTADQLKAFLDLRGGDYDESTSLDKLIERAVEVEINTGPAPRPDPAHVLPAQQLPVPAPPTADGGDDDEYDPLEAFMSDITSQVKAGEAAAGAGGGLIVAKPKPKPDLACDEAYDALDYAAARKPTGRAAGGGAGLGLGGTAGSDSDEEVYAAARAAEEAAEGLQYDENGFPILEGKKRTVDVLPPLDHSTIEYEEFAKDFYEEGPELFAMDDKEVAAYRRQLELTVAGFDPPKPVKEFNQCGFDGLLLAAITKAGYERPTAIQAQALPAALSGRDVLGIAKTGSGKTAAFVLPMLVHIMDQPELAKGAGPIGVVVAPTRELAEQIHKETRKFSRVYTAIGGLSKYEQVKELKAGSEVAVATPGRLIDLIKHKACTMSRATYLVLDEADRMFDMGFEPQVRSILGQIRPDRQTLLFSATMPKKVQRLVADALSDPITITVGVTGVANSDVRQEVALVANDGDKLAWLTARLPDFIDQGEVIIFVSQRARVESLVSELSKAGARAGGIHGDLDQHSRSQVLDSFRAGKLHVLVATDIAARGLDIKTLKTVVNYDAAKDIDTHIHRVGRTGRAGDKEGLAMTLLLPTDTRFAGQLAQSLALAGQGIPFALHELAQKNPGFRKGAARSKGGKGGGRRPTVGGAGLGFDGGGASSTAPSASGRPPGPPPQLSGFTRSHDRYEDESSAAAAPTPPAPPPSASVIAAQLAAAKASAMAAAMAAAGTLPPPPPLPEGGAGAARAMAAPAAPPALPSQPMQPPQPPVAHPSPPLPPQPLNPGPSHINDPQGSGARGTVQDARRELASATSNAREYVHTVQETHFRSNFVSSGTAGGTVGAGATIVAPKLQSAGPGRPLPPPPVPVTQRPMYLTAPAGGGFGAPRRSPYTPAVSVFGGATSAPYAGQRDSSSTASYHSAPPPTSGFSAAAGAPTAPSGPSPEAAARAIAAAQAIAARLASQAPRGAE